MGKILFTMHDPMIRKIRIFLVQEQFRNNDWLRSIQSTRLTGFRKCIRRSMFDTDSVSYQYAQWDGSWSVDELSAAAQELFTADEDQYFISWATGTIEPKSGGMGGSGAPGGGFGGGSGEKPSGSFGGPGGSGNTSGMSGGPSGGTNSSAYHMASLDYAYNCVSVMEWLFQQGK